MKKLIFVVIFTNLLFAKIGIIDYMKGKVIIVRKDINITAKKNIPLEVNDTVFTLKNSFVKMKFNDNTIISLGENSKFKIEEYIFNKQNSTAKFKFFKGIFRSITGKIGKITPKRFKLQTKNVSIGVRGTIVLGKILKDNNLIMCEEGVISVVDLYNKKSIVLKAGEGILVAKDFISNIIKMPFNIITNVFKPIFVPLKEVEEKNKINSKVRNDKYKNKHKLNLIENRYKKVNQLDYNWSSYIIEPLQVNKENNNLNRDFKIFDNEIYNMFLLLKGN